MEMTRNWRSCQKFLSGPDVPSLELLEYLPEPAPAEAGDAEKPPILFVHGAWSSCASWEPHFLPWFAGQGYRCYALSLQGHGASGSGKWLRLCRVDDYLQDLRRAVEHIGNPLLAGLSMGGYLVQKYLEKWRAPAAVLMSPVPVEGTAQTTLRMWRDRPWNFLLSSLFFDTRWLVCTHDLVRRSCFSSRIPREETRKFFEETGDESVLIQLDMSAAALPDPAQVQDPVLVMGAENDFFFPPDQIQKTARAYGTEAVILPKTAHVIPLEPAWEEAARHIDSWIRTTVAGAKA